MRLRASQANNHKWVVLGNTGLGMLGHDQRFDRAWSESFTPHVEWHIVAPTHWDDIEFLG